MARPTCERCNSFVTRGFRLCGLCEFKERQKKWVCKTPPCEGKSFLGEHPDTHYRRIPHQFPSLQGAQAIHDHTTEDQYRDWRRYL